MNFYTSTCRCSVHPRFKRWCLFWNLKKYIKCMLHFIVFLSLSQLSMCPNNKSPKGHWSLTWVQWALLLKVRFLVKSESLTFKFVKSIRTAKNHNISIQDMRMHSVCCWCNPIWRRSPLEKGPAIDPFFRRLGSTSGRICPKSLNACAGPWLLNPCQVL